MKYQGSEGAHQNAYRLGLRNPCSFATLVRALGQTLQIGNNFMVERPLHKG